jgi:glycosyltransferase involved in cell wall biosynthesis
MKIAVFHNYLDNIGGAEIVALTLTRELGADLYTTNISLEKIGKMGFSDLIPRIYSIGKIPKAAPFRQQLALWKFKQLNLSGKYEFFIIAGDWAMSGAVNHHPNLWYAHSPLNELWEFRDFIKKELLNFWEKPIYNIWVLINQKLSLSYSHSVDNWVANSLNTKARIKKYYYQDAQVIYPPIDTRKYFTPVVPVVNNNLNASEGKYWLSVNRLAVHKRSEMQIEAFKKLPSEKLIMVASYEKGVSQFENCKKKIASGKLDNVIIKHWVSDEELKALYAGCTGFITTAQNEDFGMTVLEAMAAGKPVIAPSEGGYIESVINETTGYLVKDINSEKIVSLVKVIENNLKTNPLFYQTACKKRAFDFDISIFITKIKNIINF